MKLLADWLVSTISLLIVSRLIPGIHFADFTAALIAAVIIGLVNIIVRPLLMLLALPITIVTFGLFTFVINAIVFKVASQFSPGFTIDSFWAALLGSLVFAIVNSILHRLARI